MPKMLTLSLRCSPKVLIEQLSQELLLLRLLTKVLNVLKGLSNLSTLAAHASFQDC